MTYRLSITSLKPFQRSMIVTILLLVSGLHSLMALLEMLKALKGHFKKAEESDLYLALRHYRSAL